MASETCPSYADHAVSDGVACVSLPLALLTSRDLLTANAQQLVEDINVKRKQDSDLTRDFKKALHANVEQTSAILERHLVALYETQSDRIQDKVRKLFATLDRIASLEAELSQFRQMLGVLYQDVQP